MKRKMLRIIANALQFLSMVGLEFISKSFSKFRLKKLLNAIRNENQRFEEILFMDDTPLICYRWIENKIAKNNIIIRRIESKIF